MIFYTINKTCGQGIRRVVACTGAEAEKACRLQQRLEKEVEQLASEVKKAIENKNTAEANQTCIALG